MVLVPSHKVVDANANKPGIIDLFKSHSLGLIGLEDAKDDQDTLATKHNAWTQWTRTRLLSSGREGRADLLPLPTHKEMILHPSGSYHHLL